MEAVVLLADHAIGEGKVHMLGAGWSVAGPVMSPGAVVVFLFVPWDQTNRQHHIVLALVDSDGQPATDPAGNPVRVTAEIEVGRPPGLLAGTPIDANFVLNYGPGLSLRPGQRYTWMLTVDDETKEHWNRGFYVRRELPQQPGLQ